MKNWDDEYPETSEYAHYYSTYYVSTFRDFEKDSTRIALTKDNHTEYVIAELFFKHPKIIYSRADILSHITDEEKYIFDRTVDVHIKNLRLKMKDEEKLIKTYRGLGYGFNREFLKR